MHPGRELSRDTDADVLALLAAELLLAIVGGDDGLAHAAVDVVAERRACRDEG